MKMSEQINEIAAALSKAQGAFKIAELNCVNPHFKSKYADLASITDAIRKPLADNGLTYVHEVVSVNGGISCSVHLFHASGQWMQFEPLIMPVQKSTAHAVGGAITYAKRYTLSASLGVVADEDDDGNQAVADAPKSLPKPQSHTITPDQVRWVQEVIGNNEQLFKEVCQNYSVRNIAEIPASCWQDCCKRLQPVIEARAKAQVAQ